MKWVRGLGSRQGFWTERLRLYLKNPSKEPRMQARVLNRHACRVLKGSTCGYMLLNLEGGVIACASSRDLLSLPTREEERGLICLCLFHVCC